jgi:hypothetical protein
VSGEDLAVDQLRSTVAALSDQQQREAAAATFFADHALPVVEGNLCTFATRAAADSVYLRHRVNLWPDDLELALIPGTDVWFLTIELEWAARVEYQFDIVRERFIDHYRAAPVRAVERAFISCGAYEDLVDANRGMLPIFRSTGMKINYVESRDGHSWESWRDQLGPGLCWLFPRNPAR